MGLLDVGKITDNDAFRLGMSVLANNRYGDNTGLAVGQGFQNFQRQNLLRSRQNLDNAQALRYQQEQAMRQAQWEQQQAQYQAGLKQQQAQNKWMGANLPQLQGAPKFVQQAAIKQQYALPKERGMYKGADSYNYYKDNNKRVNPNIIREKKVPLVSMGKGGDEWDKTRMGNISTAINDMRGKATTARGTADQLNRLENLLSDDSFKTGDWENTKYRAEKQLKSMGMPVSLVNNYTSAQEFESGSGELVRQFLNEATGPQTDTDRAFLESITPQLGKDKAANKKLISFSKSRNLLNNLYANEMQSLYAQNSASEAIPMFNKLDMEYRTAPASINVNGVSVHFADYYKKSKAAKRSDAEILQSWIESTRGM